MTRSILRYAALVMLVAGLTALAFTAGFGTAIRTQGSIATSPATADRFRVFWEAWRFVETTYVDRSKIDPQQMTYGAIRGAIGSLDDPYTTYLDPTQYQVEHAELQGNFGGIGANVNLEDGQVTIVSPIAGSPAERAGIRPGTKVLEIDGQSTAGMSLGEAVSKIRGPVGTAVRLTVLHPGEAAPATIDVTREEFRQPSVTSRLIEPGIGYVRLSQFTARSNEELVAAIERLRSEGAEGFVVDLRHNPGGLLDAAVDVTSQFVGSGVIVQQVRGDGSKRTYEAKPAGVATAAPVVVLVDKGSASSSEVMAGAIRDHQRGTIVGEQTYGKGSVTILHPLSDGSAINVTSARWLTPSSQQIEGTGVTPDIVVSISDADRAAGRDTQLDRALDVLRNRTA